MLWFPDVLHKSLVHTCNSVNLGPIFFIRKALELHQLHRNPDQQFRPKYPDSERLSEAYKTLQADEFRNMMFELSLAGYQDEINAAIVAHAQGYVPQDRGIHVLRLAGVAPAIMEYVDSVVSPIEGPGKYLGIRELGVAATYELVTLYSVIGEAGNFPV